MTMNFITPGNGDDVDDDEEETDDTFNLDLMVFDQDDPNGAKVSVNVPKNLKFTNIGNLKQKVSDRYFFFTKFRFSPYRKPFNKRPGGLFKIFDLERGVSVY